MFIIPVLEPVQVRPAIVLKVGLVNGGEIPIFVPSSYSCSIITVAKTSERQFSGGNTKKKSLSTVIGKEPPVHRHIILIDVTGVHLRAIWVDRDEPIPTLNNREEPEFVDHVTLYLEEAPEPAFGKPTELPDTRISLAGKNRERNMGKERKFDKGNKFPAWRWKR